MIKKNSLVWSKSFYYNEWFSVKMYQRDSLKDLCGFQTYHDNLLYKIFLLPQKNTYFILYFERKEFTVQYFLIINE